VANGMGIKAPWQHATAAVAAALESA